MALLDLSLVTKTLTKLVEVRVNALLSKRISSTVWPASRILSVSPEPPDEMRTKEEGDVLGLYLYHVGEDAHFKNLPPPTNDQPPIQYTPMGLNLYYQLSAYSDQAGATGIYREQLTLGLAIKTLRDYPVIDDTTKIVDKDGTTIEILKAVGLSGGKNRLRIVLQPIPQNEAVNYWTAGSVPLRLAVYYQVSVVLLEPEETESSSGRVLKYGVHTFVGGAPRLHSSWNVVTFSLPGETETREIELRPAQAPPVAPAASPIPEESKLTLTGSNLAGDRVRLFLKNARWQDPVEVDSAWGVTLKGNDLAAVARQTAGTEDVIPGVYAALVKVTKRRTMPDGRERDFEHVSNQTPFAVAPRIENVAESSGVFTVTGYIFQHTSLEAGSVQIYLGEDRLVMAPGGSLNPGEFTITGATQLEFMPPAGLTSGAWVSLRLLINGIESLPRWIQIP